MDLLTYPSSSNLQASLPVVDNNQKIVGALSVVGEKSSKILANFCKISEIFELLKNFRLEKGAKECIV